MKNEKKIGMWEIIKWEMSYGDGFYGILTNPLGEEGFLSRYGGAASWTKIGEGQDEVEVMKAAKTLHDALNSGCMDTDILGYLGSEVERLSNPKVTNQS
jgi:hypothetical protein